MTEHHTTLPLSPLRKVIAARMSEAMRTIPHFRLVAEIEMDALLATRARANAAGEKVSVNDCLIKACAIALLMHPDVNCQFVDNVVHRYRDADISVIVAVEGGLAMPIIHRANAKSVLEIAAEVKALSARAAARQLKMREIVGGSFSISNLGSHGIDQFDAIINAPQCAILAVGRARPRVVVSAEGQPRIATLLTATLSVDHRVIDGVVGASFLATLRRTIEQPQVIFQ
jgi:pyruvate dehydrogenase E2 component (dihydrolipoamide acetyltransferase)